MYVYTGHQVHPRSRSSCVRNKRRALDTLRYETTGERLRNSGKTLVNIIFLLFAAGISYYGFRKKYTGRYILYIYTPRSTVINEITAEYHGRKFFVSKSRYVSPTHSIVCHEIYYAIWDTIWISKMYTFKITVASFQKNLTILINTRYVKISKFPLRFPLDFLLNLEKIFLRQKCWDIYRTVIFELWDWKRRAFYNLNFVENLKIDNYTSQLILSIDFIKFLIIFNKILILTLIYKDI